MKLAIAVFTLGLASNAMAGKPLPDDTVRGSGILIQQGLITLKFTNTSNECVRFSAGAREAATGNLIPGLAYGQWQVQVAGQKLGLPAGGSDILSFGNRIGTFSPVVWGVETC